MENWTKRFLLMACGLLCTPLFTAQAWSQDDEGPVQVIKPDLERRDIEPAKIDSENFEIGVYYGILSIQDFNSNEVLGVRLAYHISEDFFFEGTYGASEGDLTSYEKLSGGSPLFTSDEREYTYYNLALGWNIFPNEVFIWDKWAFHSNFYVVAGAGNTEFVGDEWFTAMFGAGYRLMFTDWMAWHIDARDHLFDRDAFGAEETTNNLEFTTGITVFF